MFFRRRKHEIEGDTLEELLESAGLADRYEALQDEEQAAIWLRTDPADDGALAIGDSKIGGSPDLAEGTPWPLNEGPPLMFLAQINLSDIAGLPGSDLLPPQGRLLFFLDALQSDEPGAVRVIHCDGNRLHRVSPPAGVRPLPVCLVSPAAKMTIPDVMSIEVEELVLSNVEGDDYVEMSQVYAQLFPGPEHQMFGHPVLVQGEMRVQLAVDSLPEDAEEPTELGPELVQEAAAWRLLLQLDSDHDAGMMWGDGGVLYFWIHEDDLADGDFSRVRAVVQST